MNIFDIMTQEELDAYNAAKQQQIDELAAGFAAAGGPVEETDQELLP